MARKDWAEVNQRRAWDFSRRDGPRRSREMNETENEEALVRLRQAGCTTDEIARFIQLRRVYAKQQRRLRRGKLRPLVVHWVEYVGKLLQEGTPPAPWQ